MSIKNQLESIRDHLKPWAKDEGGDALIAYDHVHLWHLLLHKPGAIRVICVYEGDDARENFPGGSLTGRVDRHFSVVVSRGRGLNLERGASLSDSTGSGRPMFDIVDELINKIRLLSYIGEDDEGPIDFNQIKRADAPEGMIVDAYQITFTAGVQIGTVSLVHELE